MEKQAVFNMTFTVVVVAACVLVSFGDVKADVTCSQVTYWLTPCIDYAIIGGTISPACCAGVKQLNTASITTEDRRNACSCIKDGLSNIPGINYNLVSTIPDKCGTTCPYQISPTTDCSRVN